MKICRRGYHVGFLFNYPSVQAKVFELDLIRLFCFLYVFINWHETLISIWLTVDSALLPICRRFADHLLTYILITGTSIFFSRCIVSEHSQCPFTWFVTQRIFTETHFTFQHSSKTLLKFLRLHFVESVPLFKYCINSTLSVTIFHNRRAPNLHKYSINESNCRLFYFICAPRMFIFFESFKCVQVVFIGISLVDNNSIHILFTAQNFWLISKTVCNDVCTFNVPHSN